MEEKTALAPLLEATWQRCNGCESKSCMQSAQIFAIEVHVCNLALLQTGPANSQMFHLQTEFTCIPLREPSCSPSLCCVLLSPWLTPEMRRAHCATAAQSACVLGLRRQDV